MKIYLINRLLKQLAFLFPLLTNRLVNELLQPYFGGEIPFCCTYRHPYCTVTAPQLLCVNPLNLTDQREPCDGAGKAPSLKACLYGSGANLVPT